MKLIVTLVLIIIASGCGNRELKTTPDDKLPHCDDCKVVKETILNSVLNKFFAGKDTTGFISEKAALQLQTVKQNLMTGRKFWGCGCRNGVLIQRIWCGNGKTYELKIDVEGDGKFTILGILPAEFSHP